MEFLSWQTWQWGVGRVIWSWSHEAHPEVNIKGNTPHRSKDPCEPTEEGLTPCLPVELSSPLLRQVGAPAVHAFKDCGDSFCLRRLLFGTEQINCVSLEFPLLHQSPFLADVEEKLHCCPCHLFESHLMQQGVPGELGRDPLCHTGGGGGRVRTSPLLGLRVLGAGVVLSPPTRVVPGSTWVAALKC